MPLQSDGDLTIQLGGAAITFMAMVGIDDSVKDGPGSVIFGVWVDGKRVTDTGVMRVGDAPKSLSIDLTGAQRLRSRDDTMRTTARRGTALTGPAPSSS